MNSENKSLGEVYDPTPSNVYNTPGSPHVPLILDTSEGEKIFLEARLNKVTKGLKDLGIKKPQDKEPPVISVLGSGGGLRAMVGFLGVLAELAKEDLLDIITYVCGVSGSTWCMASLYENDKWSSCMDDMETQISDRLVKSTWSIIKIWEKLIENFSEDMYSLTNFWADTFVYEMIKQMNEKPLTTYQLSSDNGVNPYPIYSAVEKGLLDKNDPGAWFEFTPHQVGFPAYKSFVNTKYFGSQFEEGKLLNIYPEMDLCYLQGLWGSAPASLGKMISAITEMLIKLLRNLFDRTPEQHACSCFGCRNLERLISMIERKDNTSGSFCHELAEEMGLCKIIKVILHIMKCLKNWEWGKTNNFLYKLNNNVPDDLCRQEFIHLVDAGLEINSAYPLILPPNRYTDLILSFDFSGGDPFETLKKTAEYCKKNEIPFPKINTEDIDIEIPTKSCYVFKGDNKETPDVMHFPLFNNENCEGKVPELSKKYFTMKRSYDESEMKELLQISKLNVERNKKKILENTQQRISLK